MPAELSRRTLLTGLTLGSVGLLSGCGEGGFGGTVPRIPVVRGDVAAPLAFAPGPPTSSRVRYGGGVVTGWTSEPVDGFDPAVAWDPAGWEAVTSLLFTPLLQFAGQSGGAAPSAAAALPEISDDGLTYTLRLRPDVRFHNGRPVTAEDYIWSWTRVLDPALESWAASYLYPIEGAVEVNNGKARSLSGLRALDEHSLQIRLTTPSITFTDVLCQPYMAALAKESTDPAKAPIGTGPFKVASYDENGQKSVFTRNEHYFWTGTPLLDRVTYRWGIAADMQYLQLGKDYLDVLGEGLPVSLGPVVNSQPGARQNLVVDIPVQGTAWLAFNYNKRELRDPAVRRALNQAVDRAELTRLAYGSMLPWGLPFPENLPDYHRTAQPFTQDTEAARKVLSGLRLELLTSGDDPWNLLCQVLQQQLLEVGVTVTISTMSDAAFSSATQDKQGDIYPSEWYIVIDSALDLASNCFASDGSSNYTGYANPALDALLADAATRPTTADSNTVLARAEEALVADPPGLFIASLEFMALRHPRVQDYSMRGETGSYYDRMWV